jgi:hypothetical protein
MTRPALVWGGIVAGLLLMSVATQAVLIVVAVSDPSFAVEADYEWKAEHWDELRAARAASEALGFHIDLDTTPAGAPGLVDVRLSVTDRHGAPVGDAQVDVEAFPNARASQVVTARLRPLGPGIYGATLALGRSGVWEFRLAVASGAGRFTTRLRQTVDSAARGPAAR